MKTATKTNYIISEIPADYEEQFVLFMLEFRKQTGCRFRFKADGRTNQPLTDFPGTFY